MTTPRPDFTSLIALAVKQADQAIGKRALRVVADIQRELSTPGQGAQYGRHRASAPGDAPAVDTGRLRQSISAVRIDTGHWRVGTNVEYALYLEFGTRKIAARPFMRPAADREQQRGP